MGMFTAYFDASGTPNEHFVVVAGYVANFVQWKLLEDMWTAIHINHGVSKPFHMSEFISATAAPERYAKQKNARADYVAIASDMPRAKNFFMNICIAQQSVVNCGFSCIVPMSIYNEVNAAADLRQSVPPYALAARSCIAQVHEWEDIFSIDEPVECIFEKGDLEQDRFTNLVTNEGGDPPIYKCKNGFAGLQAADHYAWEQYYYLKKERLGQHLPVRESFAFLLNMIPKIHRQVTREGLINLCQKKGINPKTGV